MSIPDGQSVTCDQHTGPQPLLPSLPSAILLRLVCVWRWHPELKEPLGKDFVMNTHYLSFINLDSLKKKWGYVWNILEFKFINRVYSVLKQFYSMVSCENLEFAFLSSYISHK